MPAPIFYAHKILRLISEARHGGTEKVLGPDSKSQVTVQYENGKPVGVREIVVSHQHLVEDMTSNQVRERVEPYVRKALPEGWITDKTIWHINPTGKFFIGGPDGDAGLTGRKIIVDTYGGASPHGSGAFSGKAPTKVDFHNDERSPLLLIAGEVDQTAPVAVPRREFKLESKSKAITAFKEFAGRSHYIVGEPGSVRGVSTITNGDGVDALGWDASEKLIYIPAGRSGNVTIVRQNSPDNYTVVATVATMPGAKTITVDPVRHVAYLFQPEYGPAPAPAPGSPPPAPGSRPPRGPVIGAWFFVISH